jgi:site-specific DNA-methyltransferase (cytosine-N4-specific)
VKRELGTLKPKDLLGMPWRVAFALQADGWWLRSDIIWAKTNPMPESVTDRPTKAHEYLFLLTKSEKYYWDQEAVREGSQANEETIKRAAYGRYDVGDGKAKRNFREGKPDYLQATCNDYGGSSRNIRTVWTIATQPFPEAHFATFPEKLVEPCVLAGSKEGDLAIDPFAGSGTVGVVCSRLNRRFVGIELSEEYCKMAVKRIEEDAPLFNRRCP